MDDSVIVVNYGDGIKFPDRKSAIDFYDECLNGTDPDSSEYERYLNILHMLMYEVARDIVFDYEDEYDMWIAKGKPVKDIDTNLLNNHFNNIEKIDEDNAHIKTNEERIKETLNDTDFLDYLGVDKEDIIKQVKISEEQFKDIDEYVKNYKGTFGELYKELSGWNLADKDLEQDDDNLFDCYYKSLLVTITVDDGKLSVVPEYVYVYPNDITDVDSDELFELDFDKPIDFNKI